MLTTSPNLDGAKQNKKSRVISICAMSTCMLSSCVLSICVMSVCVTSICVIPICVMSICVTSICVTPICVMSSCMMSMYCLWFCVVWRRKEDEEVSTKKQKPHTSMCRIYTVYIYMCVYLYVYKYLYWKYVLLCIHISSIYEYIHICTGICNHIILVFIDLKFLIRVSPKSITNEVQTRYKRGPGPLQAPCPPQQPKIRFNVWMFWLICSMFWSISSMVLIAVFNILFDYSIVFIELCNGFDWFFNVLAEVLQWFLLICSMGFANLFDVLIFSMFWLIFSNGLIIFQLIDVSMFWLVFFNGFYWCVQCFSLFFFNVLFDFLRCFLLISFLVLIDVSMLWLILQCLVWFSSIFVIDLFNVLIAVFSSFDCIFQCFVLFFPRLNCFVNGFDSVFLIFYLLNILIDSSIVFIDLLNGFYWFDLFNVFIDFSMFCVNFFNVVYWFVQCFDWFFNVLFDFLQCFLLICSMLLIVLVQWFGWFVRCFDWFLFWFWFFSMFWLILQWFY